MLTGSPINQGTINVNGAVLRLDGGHALINNQGTVAIADSMVIRLPGGTGLEFRNDAGWGGQPRRPSHKNESSDYRHNGQPTMASRNHPHNTAVPSPEPNSAPSLA